MWARSLKQFRLTSRQTWAWGADLAGVVEGPIGHARGWTFILGKPWETLRRGAPLSELFYRQTILCTNCLYWAVTIWQALFYKYQGISSSQQPYEADTSISPFDRGKNWIFSSFSKLHSGWWRSQDLNPGYPSPEPTLVTVALHHAIAPWHSPLEFPVYKMNTPHLPIGLWVLWGQGLYLSCSCYILPTKDNICTAIGLSQIRSKCSLRGHDWRLPKSTWQGMKF